MFTKYRSKLTILKNTGKVLISKNKETTGEQGDYSRDTV